MIVVNNTECKLLDKTVKKIATEFRFAMLKDIGNNSISICCSLTLYLAVLQQKRQ